MVGMGETKKEQGQRGYLSTTSHGRFQVQTVRGESSKEGKATKGPIIPWEKKEGGGEEQPGETG